MNFGKVFITALCVALTAAMLSLFWLATSIAAFVGAVTFAGAFLGGFLVALTSEAAKTARETVAPPVEIKIAPPEIIKRPHKAIDELPSSALLEAIMESAREGILVLDEKMRVAAANGAARRIFSETQGELKSRRLIELTRHQQIYSAFQNALEEGARAEIKIETNIGEKRIFDLRVTPLRDVALFDTAAMNDAATSGKNDAAVRGAIGIFFDITRLEQLERARQEFLSNVSHELRTPLTAILTFVETLESGAIDDAANNRRFLQIIQRNAARMRALIDDILELSAIESGAVSVEIKAARLHQIVNDCFTALDARAKSKDIELHNKVAADARVLADPRRLEQILTNLIDNAIKFNREAGSVTVEHTLVERHLAGDKKIWRDRITVTDTGDGISPEHIKRIFERFYRVDRARSRELGGTGLGLAIVKHLVRMHGGEVSVDSKLGAGSTFAIELPRAITDDEAQT
jgi:two-component system phosphate regulon sensor histidine kinase PhoR